LLVGFVAALVAALAMIASTRPSGQQTWLWWLAIAIGIADVAVGVVRHGPSLDSLIEMLILLAAACASVFLKGTRTTA
jgi:hypothetical protein